jgi:tail assembly chaperone
MIETKTITINGNEFFCTQFPARKGLKIQFKLFKLIGPLFATATAMQNDNIDLESVTKGLMKSLNEDEFFNFIRYELMQDVRINGQEINDANFDMTFAGDYKSLYELIFFVIKTNYGNFFSKVNISNMISDLVSQE